MAEIVDVPLSDLLVDMRNARLTDEQPNQSSAILALAKQQGSKLIKLAKDIVDYGLDPTTLTAVIPTSDQRKRYIVLEGNRRITALKALETPNLVEPAFNAALFNQLKKLAIRYADKPLNTVKCVLFKDEDDAEHWITLRHTGQNGGVGLVEWGSEEQDRYEARHGRQTPSMQIVEFVQQHGNLSEHAKNSKSKYLTNLARLIADPDVRKRLGIDLSSGEVVTLYPIEETAKGLTRILEDLKSEKIKVSDIYTKQHRLDYINSIDDENLPNPSLQLPSASLLSEAPKTLNDAKAKKEDKKPQPKRKPRKSPKDRTALIPPSCELNIAPPRINQIYNELLILSTDSYANACSVMLRVFIELSIDHYLEPTTLLTAHEKRHLSLAKRIKTVANDLLGKDVISPSLHTAVERIADGNHALAASAVTLNQYVHNQYVFPKPSELRIAWDELQPFMEKLWPA